jgi:hypothetical protein
MNAKEGVFIILELWRNTHTPLITYSRSSITLIIGTLLAFGFIFRF